MPRVSVIIPTFNRADLIQAAIERVLAQTYRDFEIIVGSTRKVLNIIEWLEAGAHIVTVVPDFLATVLIHPYSKETGQMFLWEVAQAEALATGKPTP